MWQTVTSSLALKCRSMYTPWRVWINTWCTMEVKCSVYKGDFETCRHGGIVKERRLWGKYQRRCVVVVIWGELFNKSNHFYDGFW